MEDETFIEKISQRKIKERAEKEKVISEELTLKEI